MPGSLRVSLAALALALTVTACKDSIDAPPPARSDEDPGPPADKAPTNKDPADRPPTDKAPVEKAPTDKAPVEGPGGTPAAPAPPALRPIGAANGQPFAPQAALLMQESSGTQTLHFFDQPSEATCREPFPGRVVTRFGFIASPEKPYAAGGTYTQADGVRLYFDLGGASPPEEYEVEIKLTETDAASNRLRGTIRYSGADGTKLDGEFTGDYCPTKAQVRTETQPIHGLDWTMEAVAPDTLPEAPAQGVLAGLPFTPAFVNIQTDTPYTTLYFYAEKPPDPCARPARGRVTTRIGGVKVDEKSSGVRIDTFLVQLPDPAVLKTGGRLAARYADPEARKLGRASILFYEADGNRSVLYSQFYSLALAVDEAEAGAETVRGRVFAAVRDSGKSMVVGRFEAHRCPPDPAP